MPSFRCFSELKAVKKPADGKEEEASGEPLTLNEINTLQPQSLSHHSTWMLMRTSCGPAAGQEEQAQALQNEELASTFKAFAGERILPIRLKVRVFGDEAEKVVYNTLSLYLLLR